MIARAEPFGLNAPPAYLPLRARTTHAYPPHQPAGCKSQKCGAYALHKRGIKTRCTGACGAGWGSVCAGQSHTHPARPHASQPSARTPETTPHPQRTDGGSFQEFCGGGRGVFVGVGG